MLRSIASRFLSWLFLVLIVVIGAFGGSLYYLVRRSKFEEIDARLAVTSQVLAEKFRSSWGPSRKRPPGPDRSDPDGWPERRDGRPPPRPLTEIAERLSIPDRLRDGERYFAVWSSDGTLLRTSHPERAVPFPGFSTEEGTSLIHRRGALRENLLRGPRGVLVLSGQPTEETLLELQRLAGFIAGAGAAVLAIGLAGGMLITKRALKPIGAMSAAAEKISAANPAHRIDAKATETELGRLAHVLNSAFDRLQESVARQARFTADASHELRTPVAVIRAQTSMARRADRTCEEYREVVDVCYAAAGRMASLVEGLMTLARTDSGELPLEKTECDLRQLVDECTDLLLPLAKQHEVTIERQLGDVSAAGDPQLLAQVALNLLSNAIRYNRPGGSVRVATASEGRHAVLVVADTGIGIPAEDIPKVFDRFYRVDRSRSSRDGGTGLGLAIAKAIVVAHGGSIDCESELAHGSTFTLRIPAETPTATTASTSRTPSL